MTKEVMKQALEALETTNKEWKSLADSGDAGYWKAEDQDHYQLTEKAIKTIKEALKQEQDEPVAYGMRDTMIGNGNRMMYVRLDKGQDGCTVPLYTKPQAKEWVGLTDDEIEQIYMDTMNFQQNARNLEAKLKEKNT